MKRILAIAALAAALFAGAVFHALRFPAKPQGYAGIEFARMTPAAAARMPALGKGAYIYAVEKDSPADAAGIKAGDVVTAIDGVFTPSAREAADAIKRFRAGQTAILTVYDTVQDVVHPEHIAIRFEDMPDPRKTKRYSVRPPRTLAREFFFRPNSAANAAWSTRIARGATTRPLALTGIGSGQCNGFAPERWRVAGHTPDGTLFHVAATDSFAHAVYQSVPLGGRNPLDVVRDALRQTFGIPALLSSGRSRPFGFTVRDFGNEKGAAGFVEYRVVSGRVQMWFVAVPGADAPWAIPLAGAVVFSLQCGETARPAAAPMAPTAVSLRCANDRQCQNSDFAATYMQKLKLGYVHDDKGKTYLVVPKRDYWIDGADGPGFYRQVGGENEKLEPGRTN